MKKYREALNKLSNSNIPLSQMLQILSSHSMRIFQLQYLEATNVLHKGPVTPTDFGDSRFNQHKPIKVIPKRRNGKIK